MYCTAVSPILNDFQKVAISMYSLQFLCYLQRQMLVGIWICVLEIDNLHVCIPNEAAVAYWR